MTEYLIAAEADKIQDFIFRASELREVYGGSNLLARFCADVPALLKPTQTIVNDGGSFRLSFATEPTAKAAGAQLADLYYQATGCSLSVSEPQAWDGTEADFKRAADAAGQSLRVAKAGNGATATSQFPFVAFCASTGVELASTYDDEARFRSPATLAKRAERVNQRQDFIHAFLQEVEQTAGTPEEAIGDAYAPGEDFLRDAEQAGRSSGYDPRNYVAYLVADGNGMGAIFSRIDTPATLTELSRKLTAVTRRSLAVPTMLVRKNYPAFAPGTEETTASGLRLTPVLPLLLGGDDLFALLPAPFAVSFARNFCGAFEHQMACALAELGLAEPRPTMSAAVVICKASYPFRLAHARGEALLKEAKRKAKAGASMRSVANFEIIVGSDWGDDRGAHNDFRLTRKPYFVQTSNEPASDTPEVTIQSLLDFRFRLRDLPQKRRTQWRSLFDDDQLLHESDQDARRTWGTQMLEFVQRTGGLRGSRTELTKDLTETLETLGGPKEEGYWMPAEEDGKTVYANAVPDLLDAWPFLYDLEKDRSEYAEGPK